MSPTQTAAAQEVPKSEIPIVGPAFQPVKTTAWKEPALSLSKGCPITRQLRRAGMTGREPPFRAMISSTNFKLGTSAFNQCGNPGQRFVQLGGVAPAGLGKIRPPAARAAN